MMHALDPIPVTSGVGSGPTLISAFDTALLAAGIANYNLLRLSSVIPSGPRVEPVCGAELAIPGAWGDRLYVVLADTYVREPGRDTWAGVGWGVDEASSLGLFVEHHADTEDGVKRLIESSLGYLFAQRALHLRDISFRLAATTCTGEPACALVAAVVGVEGWD